MGEGRGHEIVLSLVLSGLVPLRVLARYLKSPAAGDLAAATPASVAVDLGLTSEDQGKLAQGLDAACAALSSLRTGGYGAVALCDADYPAILRETPAPPPMLFYRGRPAGWGAPAVAIVGARRASLAGVRIASGLARDLARLGFVIVSGLARGIDTAAHRGALEAGGKTVAVLGCGIDMVYPAENKALAAAISESGAVMTEQLPATPPLRQNFPLRNRIISGLSLGTVVVEAGEVSGALITASYALEQNRSVFAVPSTPGHSRSKGTNRLLKEGATLVESATDILNEVCPQIELPNMKSPDPSGQSRLSSEEERVVELLSDAPVHVDEISRDLNMESRDLLRLLLALETRGVIRSMPGKFYIRETVC
jgi:DNA processing protein